MNIPVLLARRHRARAVALGAIALSAGAIVLLRAPHASMGAAAGVSVRSSAGISPRREFSGPALHGRIALSQAAVAANGERHVYAEIRVNADAAPEHRDRSVALAVVLDTSGSMAGEKIAQARNAVLSLVDRMRDDDRITFVTYSDSNQVVQPLARVADVRAQLHLSVPMVQASGGTSIPPALELGANLLAEAPPSFARRVVLVSDGQDGSGIPFVNVASDLRDRATRGVTVSSLGVGADYDEAFMTRVADAGRGNYEFLRDGSQLSNFLARELREASDTSVEQLVAGVTLPFGWRVANSYGADVSAVGQRVSLPIGAMFAGDQRTVVLDLVVPAGNEGTAGSLRADVHYAAGSGHVPVGIDVGALALEIVSDETRAQATRDITIFAASESVALAQRQREAVDAWRNGEAARAQQLAQQNAAAIQVLQQAAPSAGLSAQAAEYARDATTFGSVSASSGAGRAYGLRSNAANRMRQVRAIAY